MCICSSVLLSVYMAGMLQSEIAARQKQHTLDTAGIDKAEAKLKLTHPALQYCGVQLSRLPSHHQTQGLLEWWVTALAPCCRVSWLSRQCGFTEDAGVDNVLENSLSAASLSTVYPAEASLN